MLTVEVQGKTGYVIRSAYLEQRTGYGGFCIRATYQRADGTTNGRGIPIFVGETNGPHGTLGGVAEATLALFKTTYGHRPSLQRADIVDQTALVCLFHGGKAYEGRETCLREDDDTRAKAILNATNKALQNVLAGRSVGGK